VTDPASDDFADVLGALKRTEIPMTTTLEATLAATLAEPAPSQRVNGIEAAIRRDADDAWSLAIAFLADEEAAWESVVDGFLRLGRGKCVSISLANTLRAQAEAAIEVARLLAKSGHEFDGPGAGLAPAVRMGILLHGGFRQREILLEGAPDLSEALVAAYPQAGGHELCSLLAQDLLGTLDAGQVSTLEALRLSHPTSARLIQERYTEVAEAPLLVLPRRDELVEVVLAQLASESARDSRLGQVQLRVTVSCSFCHDGLSRQEAVFCSGCLAPHHEECFLEHGRCSAAGCGETEIVRPSRPVETAPGALPAAARSSRLRWLALPLALVLGVGVAALMDDSSEHDQARRQLEEDLAAKIRIPKKKAPTPVNPEILRKARKRTAKAAREWEAEQARNRAMQNRLRGCQVSLDFDAKPLPECIGVLRTATGLNFTISADAKDLLDNESVVVTLDLKEVSAENALHLILASHESLSYSFDHDVVAIRTKEDLKKLLLEVYDVQDIISGTTKASGGYALGADYLVELLESLLGEEEESGSAEISGTTLVLRKTQAAHAKTQELLAYLRGAEVKEPPTPAWAAKLQRLLEREVTLKFSEAAPLSSIVSALQDATGAPIALDPSVDAEEAMISLTLHKVTARDALRIALEQVDLTYSFAHELILITPQDRVPSSFRLRILDVEDVCRWMEPDVLESVVTNAVGEDAWDEPASIQAHRGQLIVFQTRALCEEIRNVLAKLRVSRAESLKGKSQ
jgi:hypothetical protein